MRRHDDFLLSRYQSFGNFRFPCIRALCEKLGIRSQSDRPLRHNVGMPEPCRPHPSYIEGSAMFKLHTMFTPRGHGVKSQRCRCIFSFSIVLYAVHSCGASCDSIFLTAFAVYSLCAHPHVGIALHILHWKIALEGIARPGCVRQLNIYSTDLCCSYT